MSTGTPPFKSTTITSAHGCGRQCNRPWYIYLAHAHRIKCYIIVIRYMCTRVTQQPAPNLLVGATPSFRLCSAITPRLSQNAIALFLRPAGVQHYFRTTLGSTYEYTATQLDTHQYSHAQTSAVASLKNPLICCNQFSSFIAWNGVSIRRLRLWLLWLVRRNACAQAYAWCVLHLHEKHRPVTALVKHTW